MNRDRITSNTEELLEFLDLYQKWGWAQEDEKGKVVALVLYKDGSGHVSNGSDLEESIASWDTIHQAVKEMKNLMPKKFDGLYLGFIGKLYHLSDRWTIDSACKALSAAGLTLTSDWLRARPDDFGAIMTQAREYYNKESK